MKPLFLSMAIVGAIALWYSNAHADEAPYRQSPQLHGAVTSIHFGYDRAGVFRHASHHPGMQERRHGTRGHHYNGGWNHWNHGHRNRDHHGYGHFRHRH